MKNWMVLMGVYLLAPAVLFAEVFDGSPRGIATRLFRLTHDAEPAWPVDAFEERELERVTFEPPTPARGDLVEFRARGTADKRPTDGPLIANALARATGLDIALSRIAWESAPPGVVPVFGFRVRLPRPVTAQDRPLTPPRRSEPAPPPPRAVRAARPRGAHSPPPPPPRMDCPLDIPGIESLIATLGWTLRPDRDARPVSWAVFEKPAREYHFCAPLPEAGRVVIQGAVIRREGARGSLAEGLHDVLLALQANREVVRVRFERIENSRYAGRHAIRFEVEVWLLASPQRGTSMD